MKILTIVGARPQFIKAATVSRAIRKLGLPITEDILHTGQHYDPCMSQVFFEEMQIPPPSTNLQIGSGSHGFTTAEMLKGIESEILTRKPDWVLVYGDTNSTLAGALAASKLQVPIAHVEAGERSYNRAMPEEINRVLTDHLSELLFCCSKRSEQNLMKEGITQGVHIVGDVMHDAFLTYLPSAKWPQAVKRPDHTYVLATLHRASNTDQPQRLKAIFEAISLLSEEVIFPVHPRTRKMLEKESILIGKNIRLIDPLSYFELLAVLKACAYVITDSGGLQKEAYYMGKKGIVLREETEWKELVEHGANRLATPTSLPEAAHWAQTPASFPSEIYGAGHTAEKLLEILLKSAKNRN